MQDFQYTSRRQPKETITTMAPRPPLSKNQQLRVILLRAEGHLIRKSSQEVEFSKSAIARFPDDPANRVNVGAAADHGI